MINFDLDRVYGTPIYWIQKMYADYKIQTLLNFKAEIPELRPVKTGYAGVGTTDTQAEFKEIVITTPAGEFFNSSTSQKNSYRFVKSGKKSWESNGDLLTQTDSGRQLAIINKEIIGDYTMTFKVRRTNGKNGFNLFFQTMPDGDNSHYFQIGGDGNKTIKAQGDGFTKGDMEKWTMENNRWYEAKVEVKGDEVALAIDNKEIMKVTYRALQTLYPSIGRNEESKEIIVKIVNLSLENQKTHFKIQGAELEPTGKVIVLTSKSPDDQNSLEEPNKVIPQELAVPNVSGDFEYEFPACSVNILRLKQK